MRSSGCPGQNKRAYLKRQRTVQLAVAATEADTFAVNAREVGLAGNPRAKSSVQGVIPDVQLPHVPASIDKEQHPMLATHNRHFAA